METQKLADVTMEAAADNKADVGDDWLRSDRLLLSNQVRNQQF